MLSTTTYITMKQRVIGLMWWDHDCGEEMILSFSFKNILKTDLWVFKYFWGLIYYV